MNILLGTPGCAPSLPDFQQDTGVNYIDSSAITTSVNSGNTLVNQNKLDSNLDNYKDLI